MLIKTNNKFYDLIGKVIWLIFVGVMTYKVDNQIVPLLFLIYIEVFLIRRNLENGFGKNQ